MQTRVYMALPQVDRYRWIGRADSVAGAVLSRVRHSAVGDHWSPLPVKWVSETRNRMVCDFPIFHPIVRAVSKKALDAIHPMLVGSAETLPLAGLNGAYVGLHCVRWVEGCVVGDERSVVSSVHAPEYVPTLAHDACRGLDYFGVPELITKVFVSQAFVDAYIRSELTGLDFLAVPAG